MSDTSNMREVVDVLDSMKDVGRVPEHYERLQMWVKQLTLRVALCRVVIRGAQESIKPEVAPELEMIAYSLGIAANADDVAALRAMMTARFADIVSDKAGDDLNGEHCERVGEAVAEYLFGELSGS